MGNSISAAASSRVMPAMAIAVAAVAMLQPALSGSAGCEESIAALQGSVQVNAGFLLALVLATLLYVAHTLLPSRRKVYVLDFAVHSPHPR